MEAAVGAVVSCTPLLFTIYNEITKENNPSVQQLKAKIETAWNGLEKVGLLEQQGKETNNMAEAIDTLTEWCYKAEDLVDKHLRNTRGSSSIPTKIIDRLSKLINPNKTKELFKSGDEILNDFDKSCCYTFAGIENNNFQGPRIIRCIAYCLALFPATHQFTKEYLVHLWIGEGFINIPSEDPISLKQVEEKYGHVLQEWLIQRQPSGDLYSIRQDNPKLSASRTCLQLRQGVCNEMTRHLSFSCNDFNKDSWSAVPKDKKLGKKLRTFLSICNDNKNARDQTILKVPQNFWNKVSRLRVLSFKGLNIDMIPGCIEDLKHLQYFNISFTLVEKLPKEFRHLQTLKFLKLKNSKCSHLLKEFHKLTNLIYVDWDESDLRTVGMPCSIGKLSKLQSLPLFKVGDKEGYLIGELKEMNELQGTLRIMDLQRVKTCEEATKAILKDKRDLTTIILEWKSNSNPNDSDGDVLRGLELHENAKVLQLMKYGSKIFPDWIKDSHLEKIHLKACGSLDSFPVLGKLKYLETLILEDMKNTTVLSCRSPDDNQAADLLFQALESLELNNMTQLTKITGLQTGDMKYIRKFKAAGCTAIARIFASKSEDKSIIKSNFMSIFGNIVLQHTDLEIMIDDLVPPLTGKRKRDDIYKKITQGVHKINLSDDQISHTQPTPSSLNDMANSGTLEIDSMAVDQEYSTHQESSAPNIPTTPNHSG